MLKGLPMYYILDKNGNPVPAEVMEWAKWSDSFEKRRVVETWVVRGVRVSTVFLGIDHGFPFLTNVDPLHYKPVLWETMIFGGRLDQSQWQYRSLEDAKRGHNTAVQAVRQAEAGFKSWLLRRRDEAVKSWKIGYWILFNRVPKKVRDKWQGLKPVPVGTALIEPMQKLKPVERVERWFKVKTGRKFRDE